MPNHRQQRRRVLRIGSGLFAAGWLSPLNAGDTLAAPPPANQVDAWLAEFLDTPDDRLIESCIARILEGASIRDAMAALSRYAFDGVQPYPHVGYKYHAVMVLQSVEQCIASLPGRERWIPILWAVDYVRGQVNRERAGSGWRMQALEVKPASVSRARRSLIDALDAWDREAAEYAAVQWLRAAPLEQVLELLLLYSTRDYRAIGHKVIAAANVHRMLVVNRGYAAESAIRSLVIAITNSERDGNPAKQDLAADRAWSLSGERTAGIPGNGAEPGSEDDWRAGEEILSVLRSANDLEAMQAVKDTLLGGTPLAVLWEALIASAGEQMLREGSFVALHTNTMVNALRYVYAATPNAESKARILLQSAALIAAIREDAGRAGRRIAIDLYEPAGTVGDIDEVFALTESRRFAATRAAFAFLEQGGAADETFIDALRRHTIDRTNNSHDYKYTEAVIENYRWMRGPWRRRYLATAMLSVNGPHQRRNRVVEQAREMLST